MEDTKLPKSPKNLFDSESALEASMVVESGQRVFVYVGADWCTPCREFVGMLNENSEAVTRILHEQGIEKKFKLNAVDFAASFKETEPMAIPYWRIYQDNRKIAEGTGQVGYAHFSKRLSGIAKITAVA